MGFPASSSSFRKTELRTQELEELREHRGVMTSDKEPFIRRYVFSTDHKVIGKQSFTALAFLIGVLLALLSARSWATFRSSLFGSLLYGGTATSWRRRRIRRW
jgi:hypothetical protein